MVWKTKNSRIQPVVDQEFERATQWIFKKRVNLNTKIILFLQ